MKRIMYVAVLAVQPSVQWYLSYNIAIIGLTASRIIGTQGSNTLTALVWCSVPRRKEALGCRIEHILVATPLRNHFSELGAIMTNSRRVVVRLSLALFLMASAILAYGWQAGTSAFFTAHAASQTYASCSTCTGTFYGGTSATMDAAIAQVWPQTSANACGIENAIAMVNYDDLYSGSSRKFTTSANQGYVAGDNNRYLSNASQWGAAKPYNQWGGYTNIAPDYGTDPRSIAFMMWFYSLSNRYFHDHIYRWQFAHSTQPSFTTQAMEATTGFVQALQAFQEPVSVTINGGLHSVVVSGAWSSNDPSQNYPAGIQGVVYRDPEGNNDPNSPYYSRQEVDINTWIGGNYGVNQGNLELTRFDGHL